MTQEIKDRIDQIRRGEVPKGYHKGKLGIVCDDWEEIPFSSLFTSTSEYTDDLQTYPLYSLTIEDGITAKTERYERSHLVKKSESYKIVRPNDYAYNPMNIRFGAVARHKGNNDVAVSGYYDIFTAVHPSDLAFMDSFLTCNAMLTYYNRVSTGSLIEKQRVHFSQFMQFCLPLPPLEERMKIAEILSTQDKVIELYDKKIEQLQLLKKACLQKMFPKRESKVPEIRFPGFTGDWEQRKLGDLGSLKNGMNFSKESMGIGYPFVNLQNIFGRNEINVNNLGKALASPSQLKEFNLVDGDVLFVRSSVKLEGVGEAAVVPKTLENTTYSGFIIRFRDEIGIDKNFKRFIFSTEDIRAQIMSQATDSANKNISQTVLSNLKFFLPDFTEQTAVGIFFSQLDRLITLHQRRRDEEIQKKKALMQLFLSGIVRVNI